MTTWDDKLLTNPHAVADKRSRVQKMFAAIAPSYDLNNRLHSLWMDQRWRRKAVKLAEVKPTDAIVDVACGTGDLLLAFTDAITDERKNTGPEFGQLIGIDFTFAMLPIARRKMRQMLWRPVDYPDSDQLPDRHEPITPGTCHLAQRVVWVNGDAQSLPIPNGSADVVSIAFGIRNVQEPLVAMKEFHRILRPGGRVIILEFSLPTNPILRGLYNFYFRKILPRTATIISGDKTGAYKYLPESVNTFIGREQMMEMMQQAGFTQVEQFPLTFGVCVCYRGLKA